MLLFYVIVTITPIRNNLVVLKRFQSFVVGKVGRLERLCV